tara:strand:+ start:575 stop:877 length:303 start_codon:yes stop_codon:yes gene_type:complete
MTEKLKAIYLKGLRIFAPSPNAPDFVLGQGFLTPKVLLDFIKENPQILTSEYDGNKQIPVQLVKNDDGGASLKFNDFVPKKEVKTESIPVRAEQDDDLPF